MEKEKEIFLEEEREQKLKDRQVFGLVSSELVLQSCLPLLVLGIALAVAGNIISKKRTVYN